uniref:Uncharacterized protein n=1 Tax=Siphoviridae sp. ctCS019 TaxID=2825378 RepID=A0A8S5U5E3_9CAUD|nr:MAG TPA: hypothetical protein [Siphoviridae sp. ctCS019]
MSAEKSALFLARFPKNCITFVGEMNVVMNDEIQKFYNNSTKSHTNCVTR